MSAELIQIFVQESEELFTALEEALVRLESRPDDDEIVQRIVSTVHNFKGNASTVGFTLLEELAHALEDFLAPLREGTRATPAMISLALEALDALRRLVPAAVAGAGALGPADRRLLERLAKRDLRSATATTAPSLDTRDSVAPPATLRVSLATLDRMLTLTGELLVARGRLAASLAKGSTSSVAETFEETEHLFADLQDLVMRARMVSIGPVLRQFLRAVRDAALVLNKRVRVEIEGEDVEIDAALVERLRDPLVHLVRNALDHGIERPDVRAARGKDPCGTLWLRAYHQGGSVVVEVKDDGAGMSRAAIARRVEQLGLARDADRLPDHDLFDFVFRPGFSTRSEVTTFSGRGVGMDVVKRNIEAVRGSVSVDSAEGKGTTVTLRLSLTVAILDGFAVGVNDQTYVVPLDSVLECIELDGAPGDAEHGVLNLRGDPVPYVRLREALALAGEAPRRESVVVVKSGERRAGFVVDVLHGHSRTVVKPMGKLLSRLPGVSGTAIEGNGRVSLVLDVPHLMNTAARRAAELAAAAP